MKHPDKHVQTVRCDGIHSDFDHRPYLRLVIDCPGHRSCVRRMTRADQWRANGLVVDPEYAPMHLHYFVRNSSDIALPGLLIEPDKRQKADRLFFQMQAGSDVVTKRRDLHLLAGPASAYDVEQSVYQPFFL